MINRKWLRRRLVSFTKKETVLCPFETSIPTDTFTVSLHLDNSIIMRLFTTKEQCTDSSNSLMPILSTKVHELGHKMTRSACLKRTLYQDAGRRALERTVMFQIFPVHPLHLYCTASTTRQLRAASWTSPNQTPL